MNNYPSIIKYADKVTKQIQDELQHGHYKIVSDNKPAIVSALGAIPKKDSANIRIIHDCSRPVGGALNDFASTNKFRYQTLQNAIDVITPGCFLAKLDLAQAYRVVKTHPSNHSATGLKYTFPGDQNPTYMVDTRLPFGACRSPEIFNELTQAVRGMMSNRGFDNIIAYLDDFLLVATSYDQCLAAQNTLLSLLRSLGFWINYKKVEGPVHKLTFLGIVLDTKAMTMELPSSKIQDLRQTLTRLHESTKTSKRALQSLAGKLNWATQCIYGGRFHLRRILDGIKKLDKPWHRTRVTCDMKADIHWWQSFLSSFNGKMDMVDPRPLSPVYIDSSTVAAGGFYNGDISYTPWETAWPEAHKRHINYKEVLALEPAATAWGHLWRNRKIVIHTDNKAAEAIINKGSSTDPFVMASLRRVFWLSAIYNFRIHAVHIPGQENSLADAASRLHEPNGINRLLSEIQMFNARLISQSLPRSKTDFGGNSGQTNSELSGQCLRPEYTASLPDTPEHIPGVLSSHGMPCCAGKHKYHSALRLVPGRVPTL